MGEINTDTYLPIHRESPKLVDQNTNIEILETGIKAIDLLQPYQRVVKSAYLAVQALVKPYLFRN